MPCIRPNTSQAGVLSPSFAADEFCGETGGSPCPNGIIIDMTGLATRGPSNKT